ncbi:hypothetical protein E2C01_036724 [Portunus trituberculatus]|uniref:Uncharacterized protein n=1 Tax=Portunus trituberculatus TaxID=210409 RepID=A0A5B7FC02_PORTR|nr:hypothetical protein [Portunus trituberculatus]
MQFSFWTMTLLTSSPKGLQLTQHSNSFPVGVESNANTDSNSATYSSSLRFVTADTKMPLAGNTLRGTASSMGSLGGPLPRLH